MDENSALIESILREDEAEMNNGRKEEIFEWKTVSYQKRNRKASKPSPETAAALQARPNGFAADDVFRSIELHSEERRRRNLEAHISAVSGESGREPKRHSENDDDSDAELPAGGVEGVSGEVKKVKAKKPKKPKITVAEAAEKIDAGDLGAFLFDISVSYESQQDIQLMRFADYFGQAFASVNAAQFPWLKTFKESTVAKMVDIPLSHIPDDVYKTSVDWIGQRSPEALQSFVLWSLDSILADFVSHQVAAKGSRKVVQQASSKSQVAMFVVLALVLRRKPDVLISLLPVMKENPKYQGQDKLSVIVWLIAQASQGDLAVGLYMWVHLLLPMLGSKSSNNPQTRDLILQLVERILSSPKARTILVNGAVRKGERLVPPSALELLIRVTFPSSSTRVKATERLEVVYPILKEVALAGSPGSKAMKQVAQQILKFAIKAVGEGTAALSTEACDIFVWCLMQNPECYKQWDMLYLDHLEASVIVLRKFCNEWKDHYIKHPMLENLSDTVKNFVQKNEKALAKEEDNGRHASLKDANKYCKLILKWLSRGHGCVKSLVFVSIAIAVGAVMLSQNIHSLDLKKLSDIIDL